MATTKEAVHKKEEADNAASVQDAGVAEAVQSDALDAQPYERAHETHDAARQDGGDAEVEVEESYIAAEEAAQLVAPLNPVSELKKDGAAK